MLSLKLATLFPILRLFLSPFTLTYFFLFFSATPCAAGTLGEKEADSTSHFRFDPIRVFYENFGF